jgi:hypothetical protein
VMRWTRLLLAATCGTVLWAGPAEAAAPVGQWRFDEGSGAIARDSSGSGLNGTLNGGRDGSGPTWMTGVSGRALHFDGDDDVALPDSTTLEPQRITVAAWVRRAGSPGDYRYIVSKGSTGCYMSSYGLYTGELGSAAFYVSGGGHYTVSAEPSGSDVWDGRWHRLVGSYDGRRVRLYVDGRQVGDGITGPSRIDYGLASRGPYIGSYHGGCDLPFSGDIDTVAIYGAALSDGDVAADAGLPGNIVPPPMPGSGGGSIAAGSGAGAPASPRPVTQGTKPPAGKSVRAGCLWLQADPGSVRAGKRTRIVATVRVHGRRRAHVRLWLRGHKLHATAATGRHGRASFRVSPVRSERRLTLSARSTKAFACTRTATMAIRVRR